MSALKENKKIMTKRTKKLLALFTAIMMIFAVGLLVACEIGTPTPPAPPPPQYENATSVTVIGGPLSLALGTDNLTGQLAATVAPAGARQRVVWSSNNEAIATVSSSGLVTAAGAGTTQIRATAYGTTDVLAFTTVVVAAAAVPVTGVTITQNNFELYMRRTQQLAMTLTPANSTNRNVAWSSSAPTVATVSDTGLVTGVTAGTATITVTTEDGGHTASVNVTVLYRAAGAIATVAEFFAINDNPTGNFFLENNLDFDGIEFTPIGTPVGADGEMIGLTAAHWSLAFRGTFDGRGFALQNISFSVSYLWQWGIFRQTDGATIRNVSITDAMFFIVGGESGILIGRARDTVVENVFIQGTMPALYWNPSDDPRPAERREWSNHGALAGAVTAIRGNSLTVTNVVMDIEASYATEIFGGLSWGRQASCSYTNVFSVVAENVDIMNFLGGAGAPTLVNTHVFREDGIATMNFSALPTSHWQLNPGGLPSLRQLS